MGFLDTIRSEYAYLRGALRTLNAASPIARDTGRTYPNEMRKLAERYGDRPALISSRETLTYAALDGRGNRYARWAAAQGVAKGDVVALMMPNRPEYMAVWLGVARAGGVTALVNTHLRGASLAHSIDLVQPRLIIVDRALADAFAEAIPDLSCGPQVWCHGEGPTAWQRIDEALDAFSEEPLGPGESPSITNEDKCLYIYTSGTTGKPKAANINHFRVHGIMAAFSAAMEMSERDRLYLCLPMYHTSGGVLAPGAALLAGGSVFIRNRFTTRTFWRDVSEQNCTVAQYIGELCRYLLNSPPHPLERSHKLRLAAGNGLRPDIWEAFRARFAIPRILEWYAATEGNCLLLNFDGRVGSVGRIPRWAERRFVTEVVRFDVATETVERDAEGFCVKCRPGETGEVISRILKDPRRPSQRFEGYSDADATQSKILRDVFEKGDLWFRSGDLMRKDERGYYYFVDRIGDTYRWKGENVSTAEVAEAFTGFAGIREANVYGVPIPGADGRGGMAAIVTGDGVDGAALFAHIAERLPAYARPLFLRVAPKISTTSTYKQRKFELVSEGYDPREIADPLFVIDRHRKTYRPLDAETYEAIVEGRLRL